MNKILNTFLDLLYPKKQTCLLCGRDSSNIVCEYCIGSISFINGKICLSCGKELNDFYTGSYCPDCMLKEHHFDYAYSCFDYSGIGKEMLHKLKYEGKIEIAAVLGKLMHDRLRNESLNVEAIVPVPIHSSKLQKRGFNQSQLIAEQLSKNFKIPVCDCLQRIKDTKEQFKLSRNHRSLNVIDAFSVNMRYNEYKYNTVLLLDDVYTTGSTVNECSKVLRRNGVQHVYVITAATGSNT